MSKYCLSAGVAACVAAIAIAGTPIEVSLDASGKLLSCSGARVTDVKVVKSAESCLSISFAFAPDVKGAATIVVKGLKPKNWILHEGPFMLGKYTCEEFAKGVLIEDPGAARIMIDKRGAPQKPEDWSQWRDRLVQVKSTLDGIIQVDE